VLLTVALVVTAALRVTGVFAGTVVAVTRVASPGKAGPHGTSPLDVVRSRAAAWIAAQVSGNTIIACYPDMCAALQAQGVAGFGGTAPRLPGDPAPWLLTIVAGTLLTSGGFVGLLRSRRTAAAA
jgi:hypothetical protein